MNQVLGALLPSAIGVAISPVPIIAVIMMLLTPSARRTSLALLAGWVLGVATVVALVTVVVDPVDSSATSEPSPFVAVLHLTLGSVAITLAMRQWRRRPRPGTDPGLPRWMAAIDTMRARRALFLGLLLSAGNPKNLTLCTNGGVTIGAGGLPLGQTAAAIAVFVGIGSISVATPIVVSFVADGRFRDPLEELRDWLTVNNTAVMTVLLTLIGTSTIGQGIGEF